MLETSIFHHNERGNNMRLRKIDAQKAMTIGLLADRDNELDVLRLHRQGLSEMEISKKLNMSIVNVLSLMNHAA